MSYVVCPACGTRIKAGRKYCLRCMTDLPQPDHTPLWVSLGLSQQQQWMIVGGFLLAAILLVAVIVRTQPQTVVEDAAQPVLKESHGDSSQPDSDHAKPAPLPPTTASAEEAVWRPREEGGAVVKTPPFEPAGNDAGLASGAAGTADAPGVQGEVASAEQELANHPDDPAMLNRLGELLVKAGRARDALPRFERAAALASNTLRFRVNLALAATASGLRDKAIDAYREAVRLAPEDFAVQFALARALQTSGDDKGAIPEFQKAILLAQSDPTVRLWYAVSLERARRFNEAIREYKRYLEMQPGSRDARRLQAHLDALSAELQ
jgi:tetratricopeptide (TPR) repeat protein